MYIKRARVPLKIGTINLTKSDGLYEKKLVSTKSAPHRTMHRQMLPIKNPNEKDSDFVN